MKFVKLQAAVLAMLLLSPTAFADCLEHIAGTPDVHFLQNKCSMQIGMINHCWESTEAACSCFKGAGCSSGPVPPGDKAWISGPGRKEYTVIRWSYCEWDAWAKGTCKPESFRPIPSDSTVQPPQAQSRQNSDADALFSGGLTKSDQELRAAQDEARRLAQSGGAADADDHSRMIGQATGLVLGSIVARSTGNRQVLDAVLNQPGAPGPTPTVGGGGGGDCNQIQNQMASDLNRVQGQTANQSVHCVQGPRQAAVMERWRPQFAQACGPAMTRELDSMISAFRNNERQVCMARGR